MLPQVHFARKIHALRASRPLSVVVHGIGAREGLTFTEQSAAYETLKGLGLANK
jgi:hypothetical protein